MEGRGEEGEWESVFAGSVCVCVCVFVHLCQSEYSIRPLFNLECLINISQRWRYSDI